MTRKQKVAKLLRSRRWITGTDLCDPDVGGSEGLRRVRELRADGATIKVRKTEGSNVREYRMTEGPATA